MAIPLQPGDPAPDFELVSDTGERVRLSDYRGRRVVVYFYPQDDTPGCTTQSCGFRDAYPRIEERNAVVFGISPDDEHSHRQFKSKYDLPFKLLVDSDHQVAEQYGAWGQKQRKDGSTYAGLIRSHFVVGEDGRLVDVHVKVSPEDSVRLALESLMT